MRPAPMAWGGRDGASEESLDGGGLGRVRDRHRVAVRFHLVVGTYETALGDDPVEGNLLAAYRRMNHALRERGYDVALAEAHEGHSWGLWRANLGQALRWLFPRAGSDPVLGHS